MSRRRRRRSRRRLTAPRPRALGLDLHLHSTRSDGELGPEAVVEGCARRGLGVVALTDHDVPPGLPAGPLQVDDRTVHLVHAAEVSGGIGEGEERAELHILAYFPRQMPAAYVELLRRRAQARAERYETARARMGLAGVAPADAAARAGDRALTRHHLARALVEAGHVSTIDQAFRHHCSRRHGHVPPVDYTAREAIGAIREAGGLAVWAHPSLDQAARWLPTLVGWGLEGLECVRPTLRSSAQSVLLQLAHQHGLIPTGGSDYHGWGRRSLGEFRFRPEQAQPFLERLGIELPAPTG